MWKLAALLLTCSVALAADPWDKVNDIKTGSDLRIYKKGAAEFITAKSAYVTESKLVVIIKNAETPIDKNEIDRIDYQPPPGKPVKTKTYETNENGASMGLSRSTNREGWTTIYTRASSKGR